LATNNNRQLFFSYYPFVFFNPLIDRMVEYNKNNYNTVEMITTLQYDYNPKLIKHEGCIRYTTRVPV